MNVIAEASQLAAGDRPVCVALGMFDGLHLGHQQVLRTTVEDAQRTGAVSVAITFDQHPNAVVAPERTPELIYSLPQRLRAIGLLKIDTVLLIHFNTAFSRQSAEAFVLELVRDFRHLQSISVGRAFVFGHKRSGNVSLLQEMGGKLGFTVHDLAPVACHGEIISSTRIRRAIHAGKLDVAGQMLGRPYALAGPVIEGEHLGRQLGFPTANLDVAGQVLPPPGVYAGRGHAREKIYPAAINIGYRPTLQQPQPALRVEAHLLDFTGDLYGQEVECEFIQKLRGEKKFASLDELRAQIAADVAMARELATRTVVRA